MKSIPFLASWSMLLIEVAYGSRPLEAKEFPWDGNAHIYIATPPDTPA